MLKKTLVRVLWIALGRRNLVRLSRFLANESRFDTCNDMAHNGERDVQAIVVRIAKDRRRPVFLDVGANVGLWTKSLLDQAAQVHQMEVHAFEPCPETFQTLANNLKQWKAAGRVTLNPAAASSKAGVAQFFSSGANVGINGLYADAHADLQSVLEVKTVTIDGYCREKGIANISLLKIDAEGHDMDVLSGASELLRGGRIDVVQFEYNHRWISARHFLRDAFLLVDGLDYALGKITPKGVESYQAWHPELETFREANFLMVRRDLVSHFPSIKWWNS